MSLTKEEAEAKASVLANRLGEGWRPEVWHNLNWCYSAKNGPVSVHEHEYTNRTFWSAYFNENSIVVGESVLSPGVAVLNLQELYFKTLEQRRLYWENLKTVEAEVK